MGAVVLLLVVVAAATTGGQNSTSTAASSSGATTTSTYGRPYTTPYAAPTTTAAPLSAFVWGTKLAVGDGLTASAEAPKPYRRSYAAAGLEGAGQLVAVTVTYTNESSRYVNFSQVVFADLYLDGAETSQLFDTGNVGSIESVAIEPGGTTTARYVCGIGAQPARIGLAVQQLTYPAALPPAIWVGDYQP